MQKAFVALGIVTGLLGVIGVALVRGSEPQRSGNVWVNVNDQDVVPGVKTFGFVGLSDAMETVSSPARRVRVLAYSVTVYQDEVERIHFYGMPSVNAGDSEPVRKAVRSRPNPNSATQDNPAPPRRCELVIRPRENRTWGSVSSNADLDVDVEWEAP